MNGFLVPKVTVCSFCYVERYHSTLDDCFVFFVSNEGVFCRSQHHQTDQDQLLLLPLVMDMLQIK